MKTRIICFFLLAFTSSSPVAAASLFVGSGPGFHFSSNSSVIIVRYQQDTAALFGRQSYYEAAYASWNGPDHNEAISLARGIRWARTATGNLNLTAGIGHITRTTSNLGQPFEFYGRLAYDLAMSKAVVSAGWTHYSDAKFIFGWSGPNNAENFLTLSLGMIF